MWGFSKWKSSNWVHVGCYHAVDSTERWNTCRIYWWQFRHSGISALVAKFPLLISFWDSNTCFKDSFFLFQLILTVLCILKKQGWHHGCHQFWKSRSYVLHHIYCRTINSSRNWDSCFFFVCLFFQSGFSSQTLTIHGTAGEGREPWRVKIHSCALLLDFFLPFSGYTERMPLLSRKTPVTVKV